MRFCWFIFASLYSSVTCLASSFSDSSEDLIDRRAHIESEHLSSYEAAFEASQHINSKNLVEISGAVSDFRYIPNFLNDFELQELSSLLSKTKFWPSSGSRQVVRIAEKDGPHFEFSLMSIFKRLIENDWIDKTIKKLNIEVARYGKNSFLEQHKDADEVHGFVITISIGGPAILTFVRDHDEKSLSLKIESGSVYIIKESALKDYSHGVTNVDDARFIISLFVPKYAHLGEFILNLERLE